MAASTRRQRLFGTSPSIPKIGCPVNLAQAAPRNPRAESAPVSAAHAREWATGFESTAMIKHKLLLILTVGSTLLLPVVSRAQGISISVGDRPYATHGARYWEGDREMIWVPGHRAGHHWVRGHYVRGERRHGNDRGFRHDDRNDNREGDRR
jgi:hypothetical protein